MNFSSARMNSANEPLSARVQQTILFQSALAFGYVKRQELSFDVDNSIVYVPENLFVCWARRTRITDLEDIFCFLVETGARSNVDLWSALHKDCCLTWPIVNCLLLREDLFPLTTRTLSYLSQVSTAIQGRHHFLNERVLNLAVKKFQENELYSMLNEPASPGLCTIPLKSALMYTDEVTLFVRSLLNLVPIQQLEMWNPMHEVWEAVEGWVDQVVRPDHDMHVLRAMIEHTRNYHASYSQSRQHLVAVIFPEAITNMVHDFVCSTPVCRCRSKTGLHA